MGSVVVSLLQCQQFIEVYSMSAYAVCYYICVPESRHNQVLPAFNEDCRVQEWTVNALIKATLLGVPDGGTGRRMVLIF